MKLIQTLPLFILGFLPFTVSAAAQPAINFEDPAAGLFAESWQQVYLNGEKAGHAHLTMTRREDVVQTEMLVDLRMRRGDNVVQMEIEQIARETVEGKPLTIRSRMVMGGIPMIQDAIFRDNEVIIREKQGFLTNRQSYPMTEEVLLSWGVLRKQVAMGFEPGTRYTVPTYTPEIRRDAPLTAEVEVIGEELLEIYGEQVPVTRLEMTLQMPGGVQPTTSWIDARQRLLKMEMQMGGMNMTLIETTMEEALADFEPAEMLVETLIPLEGRVPEGAVSAVYRVSMNDGSPVTIQFPESAFQRVKAQPDGSVEITVSTSPLARDELTADPAELLKKNFYLNLPEQGFQQVIDADLSKKSPSEQAYHLEQAVHAYVDNKTLGVAFATAADVLDTREGDCTEHAVLLAALAREAGIPSRVVSGLVLVEQFQGIDNVMGFHMWTQVFIEGLWIDLDAAVFDGAVRRPVRLAIGSTNLNEASMAEAGLQVAQLVGAVDVELVSAE